jgi:UDP-2,3-diacylglucosamine pyrophosphatase LpxH
MHNDVVQKILRRARKGAQIFFLPGNHDEVARDFCGLSFGGVSVMDEVVHTTADGKRFLVLHGDQFDAVMGCAEWLAHLGDRAYEFSLILNRFLNFFRRKLGFPYWSLSAYLKHKVKNAVEHISKYENFIAERARYHKADGVICGHIHHAETRYIGDVLYCNDGDWVESCTALVEDKNGKLTIINWPRDREHLLNSITVAVSACVA